MWKELKESKRNEEYEKNPYYSHEKIKYIKVYLFSLNKCIY